uniref:SPOR domain-containing protein n=1 Tax=Vibrio ziniensis TaxID=2711221 RepID=A0A6G7CPY8_9VIBR|nr:SPOR domain-containing protein [Vibrio ziniensis]QIH44207.1 SPOR domain-containing protein [Vibrio ziniensis]
MNKLLLVGLSALLAACSSGTYTTDVKSESHREEYKMATIQQPVVSESGMDSSIVEKNVEALNSEQQATEIKAVATQVTEEKKATVATSNNNLVSIIPPTAKQVAMNPRFGYTIQVVAVGSQSKVDQFASKLPKNGQPIWENYKVVNGVKWYTILYGDYATRKEATNAISRLPADFKDFKPFAKSIDEIKNSEFPTLNKLN